MAVILPRQIMLNHERSDDSEPVSHSSLISPEMVTSPEFFLNYKSCNES